VNKALVSYATVKREWDELSQWLNTWLPMHEAERIASMAAAGWFFDACKGVRTTNGPYAELYSTAVGMAWQRLSVSGAPNLDEIEHYVPIPSPSRSCDVARFYALLNMVTGQAHWGTADLMLLLQNIQRWRPELLHSLDVAKKILDDSPVAVLLRCAVEVTESHRCVGDQWCEQSAVLWSEEDTRSDGWIQKERFYRGEV
jgi:hypothetical protein